MKKSLQPILLLFILSLLAQVNCTFAQNRYYDNVRTEDGAEIPFSYHLPDQYDQTKSYPIIIAPGDGTPGSDFSFFWRGADTGKYGWILVETPAVYQSDQGKSTEALLCALREKFKPEGSKFHLIGWSGNSGSVFRKAQAFAYELHSVTGFPGHPSTTDEAGLLKLKPLKVSFIVGSNDSYWLTQAKNIHQRLIDLEVESYLEIVPDGGHVLSELIGDGLFERLEKLRE